MRYLFFILVGLFIAMPCWAAKIHLNSGSVVEGNIVETSAEFVRIDVSGVPVTYYKDEIARIEGDNAAARGIGLDPDVAPAVVAAAPVEEAVASLPVNAASVQEDPVSVSDTAPSVSEPSSSVIPAAAVEALPEVAAPLAANPVPLHKKELILKFIDVFGTRQAMLSNFSQMLAQLPPDQAKQLQEVFSVDAIIEELVPVYDRHFSEEELNAFIGFYSSPDGGKLVSSIPQIMQESVEVSARYFEARMPEELKNLPAPAER